MVVESIPKVLGFGYALLVFFLLAGIWYRGWFSRRLGARRTDACIECGKCERACPTDVARRDVPKSECYLCGRCVEACPVDGALIYERGQ